MLLNLDVLIVSLLCEGVTSWSTSLPTRKTHFSRARLEDRVVRQSNNLRRDGPHRSFLLLKALATDTDKSTSSSTTTAKTPSAILSKTGHDNTAWINTWTTCPEEIPPTVMDFPNLPEDFPTGTYYRNGHGRFQSADNVRVQHMFDGDGLVCAMTFDSSNKNGGRVLFRNRFVQTEGYMKDLETGTMSAPGTFGTKVSGGFVKNLFRTDFKNVANTHVLYANETLYALWEAGLPYRLNPLTLENKYDNEPQGCTLNGLLVKDATTGQGNTLAAHYRYDPASRTYVDFSVQLEPGDGVTKIRLYEFDESTMEPIRTDVVSAVFEGTGFIHDFGVTENWCIFSAPPSKLNTIALVKALFGLAPFASVVDFQNDADYTQMILIPRLKHIPPNLNGNIMKVGEDERIKVIKVPYHFSFHCANAFENKEGNVVVDFVQMTKGMTGIQLDPTKPVWETVKWETDVCGPSYVRYTLNPALEEMSVPPQVIATNRATEFPSANPSLSTQPFRYAYMVATHENFVPDPRTGSGSGPGGAILKADTSDPNNNEYYSFEPNEFVGEPLFVSKKQKNSQSNDVNEDAGYVIVLVVDGIDLTTDLVILDVEGQGTLQKGPVARLRLPTYIPPGLHGTFVENLTFDF